MIGRLLPPHPGPLPRGEGGRSGAVRRSFIVVAIPSGDRAEAIRSTIRWKRFPLSPGERAGVRGKETSIPHRGFLLAGPRSTSIRVTRHGYKSTTNETS